jgi:cell wall-associated NlpC family hydrolase
MSVGDAIASMQAIQTRILQLTGQSTAASASTSATSAASFADALSSATDTSSTLLGNGTVTGDEVAAAAQKYVGVPYVLGGTTSSGIDCSGLVQRTFADLGIDVPRLVHEQQTIGTEVPSLAEAQPGDLIVMDGGDHIAIYLGNNTVIHAPYEGRTVSVQKLWVGDEGIDTIRRVVPTAAQAGAAQASATQSLTSLLGAGSGSSDSLSSMLSLLGGSGTTTSSSTVQQLLAARSALVSGGVS